MSLTSNELHSVMDFTSMLIAVLPDACARLNAISRDTATKPGHYLDHLFADVDIQSWRQSWPDTACGFPRLGGQAFTDAQTVTVTSNHTGAVIVYIARQFAYSILRPSEQFYEMARNRALPGAADYQRFGLERAAHPSTSTAAGEGE